ncbi:MarR family transcriptional regulator [Aneurinibacillus sp. Ricciae_BoGa-3]|uniref:MarR family winged helix-turn-helix transcriptional regulator n=1 Tax=Aneurinibacillus sp. Ricciae_BoGa-3 TaxID=3022697 RepID=UPI0023427069|nr:MarR family transcriptional regulator [Aneurinibacillus sp. Ricciae_BoGa-3]WCK53405.1 MarR family transcriptional regulator [Aneurinibacillus sp. Ricciae_BoGa-3]
MGFIIGQTYRKIIQLLFHRLKDYGITPEQWTVLYRISQEDGINQKEIAVRTGKDQPTTARILDVLYKKGFVQKEMSTADRRAFLVFLTDKGKTIVEQTIPIEKSVIGDLVSGINSSEIELVKKVLIQMGENLKNNTRD